MVYRFHPLAEAEFEDSIECMASEAKRQKTILFARLYLLQDLLAKTQQLIQK